MSSFYGMSQNQKPFVFDRIYGNYTSALAAAMAENGDGVYPGRYILIEYDSPFNDNALKNIYQRIDKNEQGQDVKKQEFLSLKIIQEIEKQTTIEEKDEEENIIAKYKELLIKTTEDNNITTKTIARQSSTDENNLDNFDKITIFKIIIETGKEQKEEKIGTYVKQSDIAIPDEIENNYDKNKWVDKNYSPTSDRKNYDSTVWMKKVDNSNHINPTLEDFYVNIADLNSPMLAIGDIDFGIPATPSVTRVTTETPTDSISITQVNHSSDSGNLTQTMDITIQSIGKAISKVYDLLYGVTTSTAATRPVIDLSTATINSVAKAIDYLNNSSKKEFPGLGETTNLYLSTNKNYLEHINGNRPQTVTTTINNNIINLTQTVDNKINYSLQTITTDELGHIINIDTATITTTIDLSIGTKPTDPSITIWGKINSIDSDIGLSTITNKATTNLWGNIHNITTNIIGSSAATNKATTNLWGNIHNINNIIGLSTITDPGTLWSNIDNINNTINNITSNISSITAAIGTKPTGTSKTTIWGNIGSTSSSTNTLWGKISSIDSSVTSISNSIGSSSDPTNTTTVWNNINRIDSIIGTNTDTSDKNTLYGKIKKVNDDLHYQIFEYEFEEPQYISSYALSSEITGASFTDNNTLIKDGITITKIGKTITINNVTTTLKEDCYKIPRKYKIIKKQYDNGKLECYGRITDIYIAYGGYYKQTGDYYSDYKDQQIVIVSSSSSNRYAIPINTYVLDDPSKQESMRGKLFIDTPDFIQLTAYGDHLGTWKDSEKLVTISKDNFFITWYSAISSASSDTSDQSTGGGQYLPCSAFRGKWCKYNKDKGSDLNSCNSLSFHVVGRWK